MPIFAALKLGIGLAQGVIVKTLHHSGHERAAKILSAVSFGMGALPAASNIYQMSK